MFNKIGDSGPIKVVSKEELDKVEINDFDSKKKLVEAKNNIKEKTDVE